jgi:nuclear pore complex protein Nup188
MKSILSVAWNALRTCGPEIAPALTGEEAEQTRLLLKIIYLTLQSHTVPPLKKDPKAIITSHESNDQMRNTQSILEILGTVVAGGFRSLTMLLHEEHSSISPSDFALLNAILRSALRVPEVLHQPETLVAHFTDTSTARYAATLLSWSDQILPSGTQDPIYANLSLTFLLELSTVPSLAESLALSGILAQIASTNIMDFFRSSTSHGIGPFDTPLRMYDIWVRKLLPFCVNLLLAIGAPIANEVGSFLNQFEPQLDRAGSHFDTKPTLAPLSKTAGYVTLSMAMEAHSLAIIASVLDMFKDAGASAGITASDVPVLGWDRAAVKEDLESRLARRNALRENLVPVGSREEEWAGEKASGEGTKVGCENRLEEKVVEEMSAALKLLSEQGV